MNFFAYLLTIVIHGNFVFNIYWLLIDLNRTPDQLKISIEENILQILKLFQSYVWFCLLFHVHEKEKKALEIE